MAPKIKAEMIAPLVIVMGSAAASENLDSVEQQILGSYIVRKGTMSCSAGSGQEPSPRARSTVAASWTET